MLANVLRRRIATTASLSALWRALLEGRSSSTVVEAGLTRRSRSWLLRALERAQHRVRTWLLTMVPAPHSTDSRPLAQLWQHVLAALGDTLDPLAALQFRTQQPLLG